MRKVGLFGGSFDPIQIAHMDVAKFAIQQLSLDEVQFIPTKNNPWKDKSCVNQIHRSEMMKLAIKDNPHISINLVEINEVNNDKNYTIDTITKLVKENSDIQYYYIMGMDQANLFSQWKEAKKISELVQLVAFQRGGYEANQFNIEEYHFLLLDNEPIYASSSEARDGHLEMLDRDVLRYISLHGLYLETMISHYMQEKRWKHTCSVALLASEIAEANHLDKQKAYIAGMFHDIAKEMDDENSYHIMKEFYSEYLHKPRVIWHQWISSYVAKKDFLVDDKIILDAIESHTTGAIPMSAIAKCIYVADKLDPLRGYDSSQQIEVCKKDIHQGFRDSLIEFYDFSKSKGRDIDECFYEIYDFYVKKEN